jgi:hypothetical protein
VLISGVGLAELSDMWIKAVVSKLLVHTSTKKRTWPTLYRRHMAARHCVDKTMPETLVKEFTKSSFWVMNQRLAL